MSDNSCRIVKSLLLTIWNTVARLVDRCLITAVVNKVTSRMPLQKKKVVVTRRGAAWRGLVATPLSLFLRHPFCMFHAPPLPHAIRCFQKSSFGNFDLASLSLFPGIFYIWCPALASRAHVCVRRMRVGWKHSDERVGETSNRTTQSGRISPRLELINSNEWPPTSAPFSDRSADFCTLLVDPVVKDSFLPLFAGGFYPRIHEWS